MIGECIRLPSINTLVQEARGRRGPPFGGTLVPLASILRIPGSKTFTKSQLVQWMRRGQGAEGPPPSGVPLCPLHLSSLDLPKQHMILPS